LQKASVRLSWGDLHKFVAAEVGWRRLWVLDNTRMSYYPD
jgi:hypothetical protein